MSTKHTVSPMLVVYDQQACIGHLLNRGRCGWEGFDADDRSRGTFTTLGEAAAAVLAKALPTELEQEESSDA